jgi:hypothetical protein
MKGPSSVAVDPSAEFTYVTASDRQSAPAPQWGYHHRGQNRYPVLFLSIWLIQTERMTCTNSLTLCAAFVKSQKSISIGEFQ